MRFVIHLICDCDLGHSVPGILCSHPQGLPFKRLILAAKLLQRKLKIAVLNYAVRSSMAMKSFDNNHLEKWTFMRTLVDLQ